MREKVRVRWLRIPLFCSTGCCWFSVVVGARRNQFDEDPSDWVETKWAFSIRTEGERGLREELREYKQDTQERTNN